MSSRSFEVESGSEIGQLGSVVSNNVTLGQVALKAKSGEHGSAKGTNSGRTVDGHRHSSVRRASSLE